MDDVFLIRLDKKFDKKFDKKWSTHRTQIVNPKSSYYLSSIISSILLGSIIIWIRIRYS